MNSSSEAQRRVHQYLNIDGLTEIAIGVAFTLAALGAMNGVFLVGVPVVIMLAFMGAVLLKRHITLPRTGYVAARRPSGYTLGLLVLGFSSMLFVPRVSRDAYLFNDGFALYLGAFLAVTLLLAGQGLRRFYGYAVVPLVLRMASATVGLEPMTGAALTALVTGLVLLVSGARVLRRYLAEHPRPEGEG